MKRLVWSYGTLQRGHGNYRRLLEGNSTFIGTAVSEPAFTMIHMGHFPGIVRKGTTPIHGEVFEITDPDVMEQLDILEGHPHFYRREPITVTTHDGQSLTVEGYVLPETWLDGRPDIVESGIWPRVSGKRAS